MSDNTISLPIVPTFKEIYDCIVTVCQTRTSHELSIRQAIWSTYYNLSGINIYTIDLSEVEITDFENIITPIYEKINDILTQYINSQILYIKSDKDTWIIELIALRQSFNMLKSGHFTKDDISDFAKHITEFYTYIIDIFQDKYDSNFRI